MPQEPYITHSNESITSSTTDLEYNTQPPQAYTQENSQSPAAQEDQPYIPHAQHSRNSSFHDSFSELSLNTSQSNNQDDEEGQQQDPVQLTSTMNKKTTTNGSVLADRSLQRPRKERRGLLAQFSLIPEFKDAREYPERLKYIIVFMVAFSAMIGPMGTSIILPAIEDIKEHLQTTTIMVNISVGIYLLSLGVFPLWWSSFSERFGRRSVYISSFTLYVAFGIGCALSPNINTLIGMRVLAGGCSASVQSVGAGTISDIYAPEQRGRALGLYYLGPLMAPLLSPIIGSLLLTRWNWRSTQWFLVIMAVFLDIMVIIVLPETLRTQDNKEIVKKVLAERQNRKSNGDEESQSSASEDSNEKQNPSPSSTDDNLEVERIASRVSNRNQSTFDINSEGQPQETMAPELFRITTSQRDERIAQIKSNDLEKIKTEIQKELDHKPTKTERFKKELFDLTLKPLKSLVFLKYPPVALAISFSAISFGILYFVNMTIEYEFAREPYKWKSLFIGFAYIPNSVSYIFASIYGGKWTDWLLRKDKERNGYYSPESRISWNIFSAVVTFPIALLIIGWCFHFHTHWVTPLIGTAIFGYSSMMTIGPVVTYLVDSLPGRGATGVALNNFVRQIFATVAVFITEPMIKGMKPGPMYSMLAALIVLWAVVLVVLKRKGTYWRENYDLQKLYDSVD
ncbi:putative membrane protein [Wickerhamomyces ciferrii]|uniref:Membrane protein n=1 Tax=Wickerhamomyces ciferrii (strain ATCC 14091 / BCRC 22168 / CBS 111 / JCM 3599 / NBRC 0793 / NRRL Y-1031 F-60-10) TaxID=1206466 RepID=K0KYZ4_WICCF|nr:uncharacterized protein BN7_5890 [Wickerhamomyces ciferrii]CCH46298.1 putative membrane protein [Wickerhamomyces ciferrii]